MQYHRRSDLLLAGGREGGGGGGLIKGISAQAGAGALGRLPLRDTATPEELLECTRSKAQNFTEDWEGKTMQIGV